MIYIYKRLEANERSFNYRQFFFSKENFLTYRFCRIRFSSPTFLRLPSVIFLVIFFSFVVFYVIFLLIAKTFFFFFSLFLFPSLSISIPLFFLMSSNLFLFYFFYICKKKKSYLLLLLFSFLF